MKCLSETPELRRYELDRNEGDCLRELLERFPVTPPPPARISIGEAPAKAQEREKLLNEALAEHRRALQQRARALTGPAAMKPQDQGYELTLSPEDREILLQILNDIRVGCWHALGAPERIEPLPEAQPLELVHHQLMGLAGYFECHLLDLK